MSDSDLLSTSNVLVPFCSSNRKPISSFIPWITQEESLSVSNYWLALFDQTPYFSLRLFDIESSGFDYRMTYCGIPVGTPQSRNFIGEGWFISFLPFIDAIDNGDDLPQSFDLIGGTANRLRLDYDPDLNQYTNSELDGYLFYNLLLDQITLFLPTDIEVDFYGLSTSVPKFLRGMVKEIRVLSSDERIVIHYDDLHSPKTVQIEKNSVKHQLHFSYILEKSGIPRLQTIELHHDHQPQHRIRFQQDTVSNSIFMRMKSIHRDSFDGKGWQSHFRASFKYCGKSSTIQNIQLVDIQGINGKGQPAIRTGKYKFIFDEKGFVKRIVMDGEIMPPIFD